MAAAEEPRLPLEQLNAHLKQFLQLMEQGRDPRKSAAWKSMGDRDKRRIASALRKGRTIITPKKSDSRVVQSPPMAPPAAAVVHGATALGSALLGHGGVPGGVAPLPPPPLSALPPSLPPAPAPPAKRPRREANGARRRYNSRGRGAIAYKYYLEDDVVTDEEAEGGDGGEEAEGGEEPSTAAKGATAPLPARTSPPPDTPPPAALLSASEAKEEVRARRRAKRARLKAQRKGMPVKRFKWRVLPEGCPFHREVRAMMFAFGDCNVPSPAAAVLLERDAIAWAHTAVLQLRQLLPGTSQRLTLKHIHHFMPGSTAAYFRWKSMRGLAKGSGGSGDEAEAEAAGGVSTLADVGGEEDADNAALERELLAEAEEALREGGPTPPSARSAALRAFAARLHFANTRSAAMTAARYEEYRRCREAYFSGTPTLRRQFAAALPPPALPGPCLEALAYIAYDRLGSVVEAACKVAFNGVLQGATTPLHETTYKAALAALPAEAPELAFHRAAGAAGAADGAVPALATSASALAAARTTLAARLAGQEAEQRQEHEHEP